MSPINILVITIFNQIKIVCQIQILSHSKYNVCFVNTQGILEMYYCVYLLDLKQRPFYPQLGNELYF
jgi:hypothetical protein